MVAMRLAALFALLFMIGAGSRAWADPSGAAPTAAPPASTAPPAAPAPAYPPPPAYAPPAYAPPPGYLPPPGYAPPPGYGSSWTGGPAYGQGPDPNALFFYEAQSKNAGIAVLLSLLIPGVGNIYADHVTGAVITWALIGGGIALMVASVRTTTDGYGYQTTSLNSGQLAIGLLLALSGEIYSPIDAYLASESYNQALAQRLGLPTGFVLAPEPIRTDRSIAWGPGLSFRF
jgi:TM2 domain-containing membrane protein YozV